MRILLLLIMLQMAVAGLAQSQPEILIIDFVKIKNNKRAEAIFYYENNWKVYREIALKNGFIKSYRLLTVPADSTSGFDFLLMTEYADSSQLNLSEARFQQIIQTASPGGPKLLNDLKPGDFRQNLYFKKAATLFSGTAKKRKSIMKN